MLLQGFSTLFANPITLVLILIGDLAGLIFGAIPGLSAFTALAIMLPLTFTMEPVVGISFLMSVYVGGVSGGFISAILLGIPGTPSSIATCFDGHALAKKGQSYRAMGVAVLFSFIGGIFSAVILSTLAPLIGQVALRFSPYEYTAVILLALTTVSALAEGSMVKGLLSCLLSVLRLSGVWLWLSVGSGVRLRFRWVLCFGWCCRWWRFWFWCFRALVLWIVSAGGAVLLCWCWLVLVWWCFGPTVLLAVWLSFLSSFETEKKEVKK